MPTNKQLQEEVRKLKEQLKDVDDLLSPLNYKNRTSRLSIIEDLNTEAKNLQKDYYCLIDNNIRLSERYTEDLEAMRNQERPDLSQVEELKSENNRLQRENEMLDSLFTNLNSELSSIHEDDYGYAKGYHYDRDFFHREITALINDAKIARAAMALAKGDTTEGLKALFRVK